MPRPGHGRSRHAALSQADRVNETLVAIDQKKMTTTDRNKLRAHGIIVQGESVAGAKKSKKRPKR